jgi:hypothetical protein
VAQGRAFVDRGITDHKGGSREAVAAAATRRLAAILAADVADYSRLMFAESLKLKPDELDRPFVAWYSSPKELKLEQHTATSACVALVSRTSER